MSINSSSAKKKLVRKIFVPVEKKTSTTSRRKTSRQTYNIDIEKMLWWPGNVYWKNLDGIYLGCNDRQADVAGFTSRQEWAGQTIFENLPSFVPKKVAKQIDKTDNLIMQSGVGRCLTEVGPTYDEAAGFYLSTKFPLRNKSGKIVGLFGLSTEIVDGNLEGAQGMLANAGLPLNDVVMQRSHFNPSKKQRVADLLSKREVECIYYLVRGMTARQIGKVLDLSHRTIEFYLERIKTKLGCKTKSELIARTLDERVG